jgi:hypothetical protein
MASQEYIQLNTKISALTAQLEGLKSELALYETVNNADHRENAIRVDIQENSDEIAETEEKLAHIHLPDETRYYLTQTEVSYVRSLIRDLQQLKTQLFNLAAELVQKSHYYDTLKS